MQQSMRLNKKQEETQGGFEELLMRSKLKWMVFPDTTNLSINNWGFFKSKKKKEKKKANNASMKSFHPAVAEENLLAV